MLNISMQQWMQQNKIRLYFLQISHAMAVCDMVT